MTVQPGSYCLQQIGSFAKEYSISEQITWNDQVHVSICSNKATNNIRIPARVSYP